MISKQLNLKTMYIAALGIILIFQLGLLEINLSLLCWHT